MALRTALTPERTALTPERLEQHIKMHQLRLFGDAPPPLRKDMSKSLGAPDTELGRQNRKTICDALSEFKTRFAGGLPSMPDPSVVTHRGTWTPEFAECNLMQPVVIYSPERTNKTIATFACLLAGLQSGMDVVYFAVPQKVAPVVDTVKKLIGTGFNSKINVNIGCSLSATTQQKHGIKEVTTGIRVFVCALVSPMDIVKAHKFIKERKRIGTPVLSLVDEVDVLTMGRGRHALTVSGGSADGPCDTAVDSIAKSEVMFRCLVQPYSLQFLITATQSPVMVKELGWFLGAEKMRVVYLPRNPSYRGIESLAIKDVNTLSTSTAKSLDLFDPPVGRKPAGAGYAMLKRFLESENPSDGEVIWPTPEYPHMPPRIARGTMYISLTPAVNAPGGKYAIGEKVSRTVEIIGTAENVIIIAYVGDPVAYIPGVANRIALNPGATLEDHIRRCSVYYGVKFTKVIFAGYTLTSRSMTPVFSAGADIFVPMYAVFNCAKNSTLDSLSQRIGRVFNDFGEYNAPADFQVWMATDPKEMQAALAMRRMEDEGFREAVFHAKTAEEFKRKIDSFRHNISDRLVSKRRVPLGSKLGERPRKVHDEDDGEAEQFITEFRDSLRREGLKRGADNYAARACGLIDLNRPEGGSWIEGLTALLTKPVHEIQMDAARNYDPNTVKRLRLFARERDA